MKKLLIKLTQTEKVKFPLNKAQEEINFMYNNTVAKASRNDLEFYVLIFFLILRINGKSALYTILNEHLDRLLQLSNDLNALGRKLKKDEYSAKKQDLHLENVLKFDVIFLLLSAVTHKELFESEFYEFFLKNPNLKVDFEEVANKFNEQIFNFNSQFPESKIEDDRYDDDGNYMDLSKSVYKTVGMRLSKKIDISLQEFTHINEIKSQSPIDLTFIQQISPELFFMLWGKFHLAEYIWSLFPNFKDIVGTANYIKEHTAFEINIFELIVLFIQTTKGYIDNKKNKKERKESLKFKQKQIEDMEEVKNLLKHLTKTIFNSQKNLEKEISRLEKIIEHYESKKYLTKNEKQKKNDLRSQLRKLKNIRISIHNSD